MMNQLSKSQAPLVSVIMPTFNHGIYLSRAIESVLEQTYSNFELLIIDNFSSDNTCEVVSAYNDDRIKYNQFSNGGIISRSRNFGIGLAEGDWIAFLDSDDFWHPEKLGSCIQLDYADVVYHHVYEYRLVKNKVVRGSLLRTREVTQGTAQDLYEKGPAFQTSSVLVRSSCLKKVKGFDENPSLVGGEDYDLWLRLAFSNCMFRFVELPLSFYLRGHLSVTSPVRAPLILKYLQEKHCKDRKGDVPIWMYKTLISSYLKTRSFGAAADFFLGLSIRDIKRLLHWAASSLFNRKY